MSNKSKLEIPDHYYDHNDSDNKCLNCGDPRFKLLYELDHFAIPVTFKKCECGLIKQTPMPNEAFFEWFFNSDLFFSSKRTSTDEIWGFYDYFKDENSRLKTSKRRFRILSKKLGWEKSKILKIGPSTGTFLYVANEHGNHAEGCDISNEFMEYGASNYSVKIRHGRFERLGYEDESFDAVILFNVIENIPNLLEVLSNIKRVLKPGGAFIFNHVEMDANLIAKLQKDKYFIYRPPICYAFHENVITSVLKNIGFSKKDSFIDIRYMHLEKITTLLRWRLALKISEFLRISRINFPIWAYPSRINIYIRKT